MSDLDPMDAKLLAILNDEFGHLKSRQTKECVDKNSHPIPWYTYPAIEYLNDLDMSEKKVFEYGCGNSSLFWAERTKNVISVENDEGWHERMSSRLLQNQQIFLHTDKDDYVSEILKHDDFDIVVIDGHSRWDCVAPAISKLRPGGLILLDNSDWYVKAAQVLGESDLIQVDMKGFGPINPYCWSTSFFFTRDFSFGKRVKHQPSHGHGAREIYAGDKE